MRVEFFEVLGSERKYKTEPRLEVEGEALLAIAHIKSEAGARILAKYPQTAQANMTARAVELTADNQKTGPEWTAIRAAWDWVKAVRNESKRIETAINAAATVEAVDAAVDSAAWPV
jgi:hypothetical protein